MESLDLIRREIGDVAKSVYVNKVDNTVNLVVEADRLKEAVERIKLMGFDHPVSVSAIDYPDENKLTLVYTFRSYLREELRGVIVHVRVDVPRDNPRIRTISDVFPSADYDEREAHEMFGVWFEGNPNMGRKFLLDPDFEHPAPLRKDFKVSEPSIMG